LSLGKRVEFLPMDALRILDFPESSFDLVNQRLGVSWVGRHNMAWKLFWKRPGSGIVLILKDTKVQIILQ